MTDPNIQTPVISNPVEEEEIEELRNHVVEKVRKAIIIDRSYSLELISATIIATLGLLTNSTAVVIGAMLIAPLFWPISGISIGIVTVHERVLKRSLFTLLLSIIFVLSISALITSVLPIAEVSEEIASRIHPTLIDLGIAFASAVIGIAALYSPKISSSAAGVAISVSLLPPLCTAGIGIAFGSSVIFWGAFLLFSANMGAIILTGIIILYFLNFRPESKEESKRFSIGLLLATLMMILVSIPLWLYLQKALRQSNTEKAIREVIITELMSISPDASLDKFKIQFEENANPFSAGSEKEISIQATVYLPEGIYLTEEKNNQIAIAITDEVESTINLEVNVVNTLSLRRVEDETINANRKQIETLLATYLKEKSITLEVENLNILFPESEEEPIAIQMQIKQDGTVPITYEQKIAIESSISQDFGSPVEISIEFIPITRLQKANEQTLLQDRIKNLFLENIAAISPNFLLENIEIDFFENTININTRLYSVGKNSLTYSQVKTIESAISKEIENPISLHISIIQTAEVLPISTPISFDLDEIGNKDDL